MARFSTVIPTRLNLTVKIEIACFLTSSRSMKGTIKSQYFGTFNNYVGLDAWTFEALRR